ncbi:MAG TPA: M2 family metallopeptidase [Gemmatimonadales bacterium]|nr:M2 family metallopeptidase [Gemmatimonadales bacterium]
MHSILRLAAAVALFGTAARATAQVTSARSARPPTVAEAAAFMARAESTLSDLSVKGSRAAWVAETYITFDTEELTAEADAVYSEAARDFAMRARRYDAVHLPADLRRKFLLLKRSLVAPPPADAREAAELSRITSSMDADYGKGRYCRTPEHCLEITDIERIMATSRDPAELTEVWRGWHAISVGMRDRYARFVTLANRGARNLGFADVGTLWREQYDMPADAFTREVDRLWEQLRPLYLQLHAYVRARLVEKYGPSVVAPTGLIPAHLLGNLWAQDWEHIYDVVAPATMAPSVDVGALLQAHKVDARGMVRRGEHFYTSLGFDSLPLTFWERSQFTKPRDRDVVCHASAWDIDGQDDVRVKLCLQLTGEDFQVVHHELGHNFYQRAYKTQPYLFQNGANGGFHEAIGDGIALSVTPDYLRQIGLLDSLPSAASDTAMLLRTALDKIAFLPFALAVDHWRWAVFAGEVTPDRYNAAWWDLKHRYQGVTEPVARSERDFDPGAKYHVAINSPYIVYFIARVLQFQFHRSWCRAAGWTGPLYRCSIYGSAAAGRQLATMLAAGASRPWQETLAQATGERQMDATAMVDYFQPLLVWLERENQGRPVGW